MAYHREGGAAGNSFVPQNLTVEEATTLYHTCYQELPDMRLPSGWWLSVGGIGIPHVLAAHVTRWWEEIHAHETPSVVRIQHCDR
jgi:hypothetical protein